MNCNGIGSAKRVLTGKSIAAFNPGRTTGNPTSDSTSACGSMAARAEEVRQTRAAGLLAKALSESDIRMEKVAALKREIEAGTYGIAAADVAASIIRSMRS